MRRTATDSHGQQNNKKPRGCGVLRALYGCLRTSAACNLVPRRGLEPPRLAALVPETSASTNSATWADCKIAPDRHQASRAIYVVRGQLSTTKFHIQLSHLHGKTAANAHLTSSTKSEPAFKITAPEAAGRVFHLQVPLHPQSSSEVRARCASGQSLAGWVPASVADYIQSEGLYRSVA